MALVCLANSTRAHARPYHQSYLPVSIPISTPDTMVLLLRSKEDYVFYMACLALASFAEVGAENKLVVLGLGALEAAVARLAAAFGSGDEPAMPVIHACTFLLCACVSESAVRQRLVGLGGLAPLVAVLALDDFVALENACLALGALARDYATAAELARLGGVKALLALLNLAESDLVVYAAIALAHCALEYGSRTAIRTENGLPQLLGLLSAQRAQLRMAAAVALARCTVDFESRGVIRAAGGLATVVALLREPASAFLHSDLSLLLANALDEPAGAALYTELGLVDVLYGLLASSHDTQVIRQALVALARLALHAKSRSAVAAHEGFDALVLPLLESDEAPVLAAAARLVLNLTADTAICARLHGLQVIPLLVAMLLHDDGSVYAPALAALCGFAKQYEFRAEIRGAQALTHVVALLCRPHADASVLACACEVLTHMAQEHESRALLVGLEAMPVLMGLLAAGGRAALPPLAAGVPAPAAATPVAGAATAATPTGAASPGITSAEPPAAHVLAPSAAVAPETACAVVRAIAGLAHDATARALFTTCGGADLLCPLLESSSIDVRRAAAWALSVACANESFAQQVSARGAIESLQALVHPSARDAERATDALSMLLKKNPSAKYALTSRLETDETTHTGFYDMGRTKTFAPLADLAARRLDSRREVLLVDPPNDPRLAAIIAAAQAGVAALEESADKGPAIGVLARLVCEHMGGTRAPGDYNEFAEFEYELSALKVRVKSNVLPLGEITKGVFYHRALLFKVLADNLRLACTLERGEYMRAWNTMRVAGKACLVDLMFSPGALLVDGTDQAERYKRMR